MRILPSQSWYWFAILLEEGEAMRATIRAFLDYFQHIGRPHLQDQPLVPPEPAYGKPAPMTGLWDGLSEEQRAVILSYRGSQTVGNKDAFGPLKG